MAQVFLTCARRQCSLQTAPLKARYVNAPNFALLDSGLTLGMPLAFYTPVLVTRTTDFYPSAKSSTYQTPPLTSSSFEIGSLSKGVGGFVIY
ncbi:hypothetical protein [Algoriphagus sp.]|uniref:hypothetical protein n=1 Tax=Algoriphagus sp. TaxID=1872435 RepID=UPI003F705B42